MQFPGQLRHGGLTDDDRRTQHDLDELAAWIAVLQHGARSPVDIAGDDDARLRREMQVPEHVAL